jgi:glutamate synthase domain-containing protein 1
LDNLTHRGGAGTKKNGDGAGILTQKPHKFFKKVCAEIGIALPDAGSYGIGMMLSLKISNSGKM